MFRVLIVEDDEDMNRTMCDYWHRNGYDTVGCFCVADAYEEMYGKNT